MIEGRRSPSHRTGARSILAAAPAGANEVTVKLIPELNALFKFQEYGRKAPIEGVVLHPLRRFGDDGGAMTELARFTAGVPSGFEGFQLAQINYSTLAPGVIKAFHVHHRQTDIWYVPPEDRILLVLLDVRDGSTTGKVATRLLLGDGSSALVRIPPGVAHGCRNVGAATARIVYMTDVPFSADPDTTDEGRLPWDLAGATVWEPAKD